MASSTSSAQTDVPYPFSVHSASSNAVKGVVALVELLSPSPTIKALIRVKRGQNLDGNPGEVPVIPPQVLACCVSIYRAVASKS